MHFLQKIHVRRHVLFNMRLSSGYYENRTRNPIVIFSIIFIDFFFPFFPLFRPYLKNYIVKSYELGITRIDQNELKAALKQAFEVQHTQQTAISTRKVQYASLGRPAHSAYDLSSLCTRVWRRAIHFFLLQIRFCGSQSPSWLFPLARHWLV